jgi:hypothetical protein
VAAHSDNLRDDSLVGPLHTKDICELLQVLSASLTDAEDGITEPTHAEVGKLLIEEFDAELRGQEREMLDDCQSDAPLLVLCELNNSREERL